MLDREQGGAREGVNEKGKVKEQRAFKYTEPKKVLLQFRTMFEFCSPVEYEKCSMP